VGKPRVLTKTASAPSATAIMAFGLDGSDFGFGDGLLLLEIGGTGFFGFNHLKLNERNSGIRYTIYKYKIISLNKMNYNKKFIRECEELYKEIQENKSIQECLNTAAAAAAAAAAATARTDTDTDTDIYEPLWFVYYMFFAIHNPKMEEYIQKKSAAAAATAAEKERNPVDIIKNMLKRRKYTSTIVYELYTHAYTNEGNVTYIYPKYKNNILIKSFKNNHLKTTAVLLKRQQQQSGETAPAAVSQFLDYVITTQTIVPAVSGRIPLLHKIENINYKRKDLIILALVCYMKVDEDDINKKNIFISATDEEVKEAVIPLHP
jgi:ribosomal protein L12E/L44/L45/RPP1/RPP2